MVSCLSNRSNSKITAITGNYIWILIRGRMFSTGTTRRVKPISLKRSTCATTKSHRGSKDREIIEFGEDESHIKMQLRKDDVPYRIDMHLKKNKTKGVAVNGIPIRRASELFGIVNVVFFRRKI